MFTKYLNYETSFKKGNKVIASDFPCVWEQGGFKKTTNEGYSLLIGDSVGNPKEPAFIKFTGSLCNGKHGLFYVNIGDILAETVIIDGVISTNVFKVKSIDKVNNSILVESIDNIQPFMAMYVASRDKASIVKCKALVYYKKTEKILRLEKSMQLKNEQKQNRSKVDVVS